MRGPRRASTIWALSLAVLLLASGVYVGLGSVPSPQDAADASAVRHVEVNVTAVDCPPGYHNEATDGVCLAYDGQIPGPTFVFQQDQQVNLTLNHRVWETIQNTSASDDLTDELSQARYTLHRHGISAAACEDGVSRPRGTQICDSAVAPNGTVHYEFETAFPGAWHYHDHALGLDAGVVEGPVLGPEAEHRGLFGAFLVLPDGEQVDPANVFDMHLLDPGVNGELGLDGTVNESERFDVIVTGLGDRAWTVWMDDPSGERVRSWEIGPGVSRPITVHDAQLGNYTWTARSAFPPSMTVSGAIEVVP